MHVLLAATLLLMSWQSHTPDGVAQNSLYRDGSTIRFTQNISGHVQSTIMRLDAIGGVNILDLNDGFSVLVRPFDRGPTLSLHFDRNQRDMADSCASQIRSLWLNA